MRGVAWIPIYELSGPRLIRRRYHSRRGCGTPKPMSEPTCAYSYFEFKLGIGCAALERGGADASTSQHWIGLKIFR
jgi:hypothetical protein